MHTNDYENNCHKLVININIQKRNKLLLYVTNLPLGRTRLKALGKQVLKTLIPHHHLKAQVGNYAPDKFNLSLDISI